MKKYFFIITLFIAPFLHAQNPLLIPPALSGTDINLTLQYGTHEFFDGIATNTMGANGDILGPTLILNQGDFVNFSVENQIDDITTIHWHGMHVSPENDGGPHTTIAPGETWTPSFTIMDKAATYWYHPHLHEKTNEHVSKGIAGLIIVKDEEEAALNLPRTYGVDDFPLVLQTKDFDADKQIVVPSNNDDVAMVNATINANLDVPAQVVRFRILNGSSMRVFHLGLTGNQTFYQIASDGGLLESTNDIIRLAMAPGERAEILIDFTGMEGEVVELNSYAQTLQDGIYGAENPGMMSMMTLDGYNPNPLNGAIFNLMQFTVGAPNDNPITDIPTSLVTLNPIPEAEADITRNLTMSPAQMGPNQLNGDFVINGASFDMNVINYEIPLGNTEIWSITNQSAIAHPFHIHDVQFFVLDRNGNTPPESEQGRKDVILIKPMETVRFICKFEDFASDDVPYMYHCHMLYHEDGGMMGQFKVIDFDASVSEQNTNSFTIYPNPVTNTLILRNIGGNGQVQILDITGKIILEQKVIGQETTLDLSQFANGVYSIRMGENVKKFIKN